MEQVRYNSFGRQGGPKERYGPERSGSVRKATKSEKNNEWTDVEH